MILIHQVQGRNKTSDIGKRDQKHPKIKPKQSMHVNNRSNKANEWPSSHTWNALLKPRVSWLPALLPYLAISISLSSTQKNISPSKWPSKLVEHAPLSPIAVFSFSPCFPSFLAAQIQLTHQLLSFLFSPI